MDSRNTTSRGKKTNYRKDMFKNIKRETPFERLTKRREALRNAQYSYAMDIYTLPDGSMMTSSAYYETVSEVELEYKRELQKQKYATDPDSFDVV